jgi:hypothetical protein
MAPRTDVVRENRRLEPRLTQQANHLGRTVHAEAGFLAKLPVI